jgi:hypothetical protein
MITVQKKVKRKRYPSDMSRNGWEKLKKQLLVKKEESSKGGRPAVIL